MSTIRAILIYIFCQFEDYKLVGANGAVRQLIAKSGESHVN